MRGWNKPGRIPHGPKSFPNKSDYKWISDNCGKDWMKPTSQSPEAKLVTASGWFGAGVSQKRGNITIISAVNALEGMCRPMDYNSFVFLSGSFIGTISPEPMGARFDGSEKSITIKNDSKTIDVEYYRFSDNDSLCCPSRISRVTFKIQGSGKYKILMPKTVKTRPIKQKD